MCSLTSGLASLANIFKTPCLLLLKYLAEISFLIMKELKHLVQDSVGLGVGLSGESGFTP